MPGNAFDVVEQVEAALHQRRVERAGTGPGSLVGEFGQECLHGFQATRQTGPPGSDDHRVTGLRLGTDDYVTKPFSPREVVLRVRAVLRRGGDARDGDARDGGRSYGRGRLTVDEQTRAVTVGGRPVELTRSEWNLLTALAGVPGRVFSRAELVRRIRGEEFDGVERIIDTHVKNLRHKVERDPGRPEAIETVLALGLLLAAAGTMLVGERLYRRSLLQTGGRIGWRQAWCSED